MENYLYQREYRRRLNPKIIEKEELAKQGLKRCTKCKEIKLLKEYWKSPQGFIKTTARCKICLNKYDKQFNHIRTERDKTIKSKEYRKKYISDNKDWWKKYEREYRNSRRQEDIFFRIKGNISSRLSGLVKGDNYPSTIELIGCDKEIFLKHIELQFTEGMNWDNYGLKGWHVDHIIPLSSFNILDENELKKACHYANLQPLWCEDNWKKGNKIK
jgi:hypothetical protein